MRKTIFLLSLIGIIVGLSLVKAVISNRISTSGVELSVIDRNLKAYRTENFILSEKINQLSSLTYIFEKATKSGFAQSKSSFAISSARPLALRND